MLPAEMSPRLGDAASRGSGSPEPPRPHPVTLEMSLVQPQLSAAPDAQRRAQMGQSHPKTHRALPSPPSQLPPCVGAQGGAPNHELGEPRRDGVGCKHLLGWEQWLSRQDTEGGDKTFWTRHNLRRHQVTPSLGEQPPHLGLWPCAEGKSGLPPPGPWGDPCPLWLRCPHGAGTGPGSAGAARGRAEGNGGRARLNPPGSVPPTSVSFPSCPRHPEPGRAPGHPTDAIKCLWWGQGAGDVTGCHHQGSRLPSAS